MLNFVIIFLIVIVLWISKFTQKIDSTTIEEEHGFFQYIGERRVDYTGKLTLSRKKEITALKFDNEQIELDSTPLYYQEEEKIILPTDMAIVFPNNSGVMNKVNHFSTIKNEEYGVYLSTFSNNKEKVTDISKGFLFDGENIYIFPQEITILAGDQSYTLSPLSYVNVAYKETLEMFDKASQTYTFLETYDIEIIAKTDDFEINLSTDVLHRTDNEQLLIKNIDYLDNLK